jgi:hypothetical protein
MTSDSILAHCILNPGPDKPSHSHRLDMLNHMCLLKPLPIERCGWPVFARLLGVSSLGADPRPRVADAGWDLCRYA